MVNALPSGDFWPPVRFTGGYRRLVRRLGFPELESVHLWRHNFATKLAANGVDVKTIKAMCGLSSAAFTLDRYCRSTPENVRSAGALSERMFGPAREQDAHAEEAESSKASHDP